MFYRTQFNSRNHVFTNGKLDVLFVAISHLSSLAQASKAFKKFLPLFDRVLIQRFEPLTTSKGGIMLPENSKGKVLEGEVLAVGEGMRTNVTYLRSGRVLNRLHV